MAKAKTTEQPKELPAIVLPEKPDLVSEVRTLREQVAELTALLTGGGLRSTFGATIAEAVKVARRDAEVGTTPPGPLKVGGFGVGDFAWTPYAGTEDDESDPPRPERIKITSISQSGACEFVYVSDGAEGEEETLEKFFPDTETGKRLAQLKLDELDVNGVAKARHRSQLIVDYLSTEPRLAQFKELKNQDLVSIASIVGLVPFREPLKSAKGDDRVKVIVKAAKAWFDEKGSSKTVNDARKHLERTKGTKSLDDIKAERDQLLGVEKAGDKGPKIKPKKDEPALKDADRIVNVDDWIHTKAGFFKVKSINLAKKTALGVLYDSNTKEETERQTYSLAKLKFARLSKRNTPVWAPVV